MDLHDITRVTAGPRPFRIPIGSVERRVARRSFILWFLVRLVAAFLLGLLNGNTWALDPRASLIVMGIVWFLSYLTARANNEDVFLANLGTPPGVLHALFAVPAATMEVVIGFVAWG